MPEVARREITVPSIGARSTIGATAAAEQTLTSTADRARLCFRLAQQPMRRRDHYSIPTPGLRHRPWRAAPREQRCFGLRRHIRRARSAAASGEVSGIGRIARFHLAPSPVFT